MTRRFDRDGSRKHHVQSLCAMQHLDYNQRGTHAYEQLFLVAQQLKLGDAAHTAIFRRMAFNVMARNCAHHTNHHALLLREGGRWDLAPPDTTTHPHHPHARWTDSHLVAPTAPLKTINHQTPSTVAPTSG